MNEIERDRSPGEGFPEWHEAMVAVQRRESAAVVGRPRDEIPTPALSVDLDCFARNAARVAAAISAHGVSWRPHFKAHKSPRLARMQLEAGARGVTCGTVGEAASLVDAGFTDVLIANVIGSPAKWERLAGLQAAAEVAVCVDHELHLAMAEKAAGRAGSRIPVLVEIDIGLARSGVRSTAEAVALAERAAATPGLEVRGVMGYEGHCMAVWPEGEKREASRRAIEVLVAGAEAIRERGIPAPVVSCGGTGTYSLVAPLPGVTEIQAGGGCLMDTLYEEVFHVTGLEPALFVEATVVSHPEPQVAIVDAGLKAVTVHRPMPGVVGLSGATYVKLAAEHGTIMLGPTGGVTVGDRVRLIPGRVDSTTFLYDHAFATRGDVVVEVLPLVRSHG